MSHLIVLTFDNAGEAEKVHITSKENPTAELAILRQYHGKVLQ